ncbi:MAG TPA: hypothetical protein VHU92_19405 [Streptosporangiaceae bacterium]|nr:hypothetical protein [Streptosporangiaceae bacterium]
MTAAWQLGGQGVTLAGAVLAGAATALLAGNPRPVLTAAGLLTILCTAVAWLAALRKEDRASVALAVLGRQPSPGRN